MKKFSKKERSSWRYFWAHWCAFQMVAITLGAWKFKYLFHDWYKPWLKMFGVPYKKIQKFHRTHSKHHIEWLMKNGYYNYSMEKYFDWEALVIDWECSQYTKENCPRGAYEEMLNYLDNAKKTMPVCNFEYLKYMLENKMLPIIEKFDIKYNRFS